MGDDLRGRLDQPPAVPFRYVRSLDGIRGVGIVVVMMGHYAAGLSKWAAVRFFGLSLTIDLFFILSGFLISTLLLEEWSKTGTISMRNFYVRRGLRLLPALFVLLAFVVLVPIVTDWLPLKLTIAEAVSAAVYLYPVVLFAKEGQVFLFHLWTLSVEEWFYFLWPATLTGVALRRRVRGLRVLIGAMIGFVVLCFALRAGGGRDALSLLVAALRPDSLILGSLLAFLVRWTKEFPDARVDAALRWLSRLGLVGFLYFWGIAVYPLAPRPKGVSYEDHYARYHELAFQSWNYRFGLLCAALVILHLLVVPDGWLTKVFSWKPLVELGVLSYALYLWHQPLFLLVNNKANLNADPAIDGFRSISVEAKWGVGLAVGVASLLVALASRRFVERPALRLKQRFEVVQYEAKR